MVAEAFNLTYGVNYPLELRAGGAGVALSAGAAASAGVAILAVGGDQITVCNDGTQCMWFLLGGSGVQATLAGTPILPSSKESFTIPRDGGPYGFISTITRAGTTTGTLNYGRGS